MSTFLRTDAASISAETITARGKRWAVERLPNENKPSLYGLPRYSDSTAAENIIQAVAFAWAIRNPMNYWLTVKLRNAEDWMPYERLRREIARWQLRHMGKAVFVWANEATEGPHIHILLHVPSGKARGFRRLVWGWVCPRSRSRYDAGAVCCRKLPKHGYDSHLKHIVRYIIKQADEGTRQFFSASKKRDKGIVLGKRWGVSRCLDVAARRAAGACLPSPGKPVNADSPLEYFHPRSAK